MPCQLKNRMPVESLRGKPLPTEKRAAVQRLHHHFAVLTSRRVILRSLDGDHLYTLQKV